jgi:CubicO group peptidase (beta-lactamase class C family)
MLDGGVAKDGTRLMSEHAISLMTVESAQSADVGLLWWRLPEWERYTLRNDAQRTLRERGVSDRLQHALLAAEGSTFASKSALMAHLSQQLGDDWQPLYATEITGRELKIADLFQSQRGPVSAYAANGYLGQHLVVVPEQRIVAVRLIQRRESHAFPVDDYATFPAEIIRLAKSMPALAAPATGIGGAQDDVAVHTEVRSTASPIRL